METSQKSYKAVLMTEVVSIVNKIDIVIKPVKLNKPIGKSVKPQIRVVNIVRRVAIKTDEPNPKCLECLVPLVKATKCYTDKTKTMLACCKNCGCKKTCKECAKRNSYKDCKNCRCKKCHDKLEKDGSCNWCTLLDDEDKRYNSSNYSYCSDDEDIDPSDPMGCVCLLLGFSQNCYERGNVGVWKTCPAFMLRMKHGSNIY